MVMGETPAFLASSALLTRSFSLIFPYSIFYPICPPKKMPLVMFLAKGASKVAFWQPGGHGHKAVDPWLCAPVFQRFCPFGL